MYPKERKRSSKLERERDRARGEGEANARGSGEGLERENETDSGTDWELACNKSIHPLARSLARARRAANRPEQRALARDAPAVCVAPHSLAVTLAARTLRRERASVVLP